MEDTVVQMRKRGSDERWQDYCRSTREAAIDLVNHRNNAKDHMNPSWTPPNEWRAVDWIDKDKVVG